MNANRQAGVRVGNILTGERGFSLVETMTSLLLFGMVASILYGFMLMGTSMYKRVNVETQIRNQGDVLFAGLTTELRDAVYARQGSDTREIEYVKKATDPIRYIQMYTMRIETLDGRAGVSVYKEGVASPVKRFELTDAYTIDPAATRSFLTSVGTRAVQLKLTFVRSDASAVTAADNATFTVESQISLSRIES